MLIALIGLTAALSLAPQEQIEETLPDGRVALAATKAGPGGEPVRHGEFTVAASDGSRLVAGEFKDGKRSGRWTFWHANGEVRASGKYRDGARFGKWRTVWPNGEKRASGTFRNGAPAGDWQFFDRFGSPDPEMSGEFTRVDSTTPVNGVTCKGWLIDGQPHGVWRVHWADGTMLFDGTFVRGRPGPYQHFFLIGGVTDTAFVLPEEDNEWVPCPILQELTDHGGFDEPELPVRRSVDAILATFADAAAQWSDDERESLERRATEFVAREGPVDVDVARGAARWALAQLASVDWDTARARGEWQRARALLQLALGSDDLGWVNPPAKGSADANRLAVLRGYTLFKLNESSTAYWLIDAQLGALPASSGRRKRTEKTGSRPVPLYLPIRSWVEQADRSEGRSSRTRTPRPKARRDSDKTAVAAHDRALRWLVAAQHADGRWAMSESELIGVTDQSLGHEAGLTGLVLVALMRDGNTADVGPYRESVARGLGWLIQQQDPERHHIRTSYPGLFDGEPVLYHSALWIYDHAIATWALCEALEHEATPRLRRSAEAAVRAVLEAKNQYGVWRYKVAADGDNDTSVTMWAVRALVAAERAGVEFDRAYRSHATQWVDEMTDPGTGRVGYTQTGSSSSRVTDANDHFPTEKSEGLTACGLVIRAWLGQSPKREPSMTLHADLLLRTLPEWDPAGRSVDYYYWLMGSEAMQHMGGKHLKIWSKALHLTLLESQRDDGDLAGSWDPVGTWCFAGGRVYSTVMAALSLTVDRSPTPRR